MDITYSKPSSDISRMRTQEMGFSLDITGKVRENAAYGKEELKSAEEIAQMAGMTDVSVQRDYMAVMSNSMSDEDFANLMAEVAVRELETNKEFSNQVYDNDKEAVEASVKESTTLDTVTIRFEDKGIYVEYMPYVLGPYASGFVDLYVSYEELLGRDSL